MRSKTKNVGIAFLIFTILWSFFIWSFSMKSAASSTVDSDAATSVLKDLFETVFGTEVEINTNLIRKLAHFCEFAVLGFLSFFAFYFLGIYKKWQLVVYPGALGLAVAGVDESLQLFFEGRSAQVTDVLLDVSGVLTAVLVLLVIITITNKKSRS